MRGLMVMAALLAFGCGDTAELERVKQERDALEGQISELKKELEASKRKLAAAKRDGKRGGARATAPDTARVAKARETLGLKEGQTLHATFKTSMGDIACELWPEKAPITVENFVGLAEGTKAWTDPRTNEKQEGVALYDGTIFHRVIKNFMIQGGDPLGSGRGGPGYKFEDEVWPDLKFDREGLLAMANAGPRTNGSQFFITTSKPMHLNMRHTIFGSCDLETVRKIEAVELGGPQGSTPTTPVVVNTIDVERKS